MVARWIERWGTSNPTSVALDDAAVCAATTREHARTFTLASHLLPARKRRAAFAVYAFCRVADDMVDSWQASRAAGAAPPESEASPASRLAAYGEELERALAGDPRGPVMRELARAARLHRIPAEALRELLAGIALDLHATAYGSWGELLGYCEGVASSVGEMCTHVFGVSGGPAEREAAVRYARTLGVAMQLTNILRDVGEDARRGRCYLPQDEIAAVGLRESEIMEAGRGHDGALAADPRWRELLGFQVARARGLYAAAAPGIALLETDARRCTMACSSGYAAILGAIEERGYDTLSGRARVGRMRRAGVLWRAWRGLADPAGTDTGADPHATLPPGTTGAHAAADGDAPTWGRTTARPLAALGRPAT